MNYSKIFSINGYSYSLKVWSNGYTNDTSSPRYDIYSMGFGYLDRFSNYGEDRRFNSGYYHGFYMTGYERNYLITIGSKSKQGYRHLIKLYEKYNK